MAAETVFQVSNPATWIPSFVAGAAGVYGIVRVFRRDHRHDKQERQLDEATNQVIETLRQEVSRLTERVTNLEVALMSCHEEKYKLELEKSEYALNNPKLF